ncbi:GyrI-like domain-containing protein [Tumebacillus sp. BK434]|uniref:GyrI-like domain-containing protein n=1 Tax=Tumebacillus sp. BK434 TaxID=2512169 RepID=UPI001FB3C6C3|nr:GyrI-like domain-containing protein [Tumebacillus sp. BK434]
MELPAALRTTSAATLEGQVLTLPAYQAVGYEFTAPYTARGEAEVLVPRLWFQLLAKADEMAQVITPVIKRGLALHRESGFTYSVTVGVEQGADVPEGMVRVEVPEHEYVCFTHVGSVERVSVDETFHGIFAWLKQHGYRRVASLPWIELFDERFNPTLPNNSFDIYIPVEKHEEA